MDWIRQRICADLSETWSTGSSPPTLQDHIRQLPRMEQMGGGEREYFESVLADLLSNDKSQYRRMTLDEFNARLVEHVQELYRVAEEKRARQAEEDLTSPDPALRAQAQMFFWKRARAGQNLNPAEEQRAWAKARAEVAEVNRATARRRQAEEDAEFDAWLEREARREARLREQRQLAERAAAQRAAAEREARLKASNERVARLMAEARAVADAEAQARRAAEERARQEFDALGREMERETSRDRLAVIGNRRASLAAQTGREYEYENHCWNCGGEISSQVHAQCPTCHWYICACGACSYGHFGH